jgi:T5SS/PEP-CTERM-associated repeat protein
MLNTATTTIGDQAGSTGTVDVLGPGSTLNSTGTSVAGGSGSGTLNITDGGAVNTGTTTIAQNTGSTGTVTVDGSGSQLNDTGTLNVAPSGTGVLDVTNGGAVNVGGTTVGPNGTIMGASAKWQGGT